MTNDEAKILIDKYNKGEASPFEAALLQYWFIHEASQNETALNEQELQQMVAEMRKEVLVQTKPATRKLWPRVAAVAAAVAMVVFGVWFFNYQDDPEMNSGQAVVVNDIAPGKNGATITLANGKVIQLSDAKSGVVIGDDKLAYNDGSEIDNSSLSRSDILLRRAREGLGSPGGGESSAGAKDMTASTTKGQTYIFTLPDGTKVWLNAASTLTIPSDFSGTESRKVALTGEAYFEVAKNKKRPFIVATMGSNGVPGQEVTVLGTHFNISAYQDEGSIKTTLLEGSVRVATLSAFGGEKPEGRGSNVKNSSLPTGVSPRGGESSIVLKPNQQAILLSPSGGDGIARGGRITVKEVDIQSVIDWKNGKFAFSSEELGAVLRKVARWYDVDIVYKDDIAGMKVTGGISRYDQVSKLFDILEATGGIKFKIEGRKVIVSK